MNEQQDDSNMWPAVAGAALALALAAVLWPRRAGAVTVTRDPSRASPARGVTGTQFIETLRGLSMAAREAAIVDALAAGATPEIFDQYVPVEVRSRGQVGTFWAAPWHAAVGTNEDAFHAPLSAPASQRVADALGQSLPTRAMVDAIRASGAFTRLPFRSFLPSAGHRSIETYAASSSAIERDRAGRVAPFDGYAKDYVITPQRRGREERIAIYGARDARGQSTQQIDGLPHAGSYVDYSQKPRFIANIVLVDGVEMPLAEALASDATSHLFSDEGSISLALQRYPT